MAKQRMDIERLLVWAFREELPKVSLPRAEMGHVSAWNSISAYGELLTETIADGVNRYGVVIDWTVAEFPHGDAIAVGDAVDVLRSYQVGLPEDWAAYAQGLGLKDREIDDCAAHVKKALFMEVLPGSFGMRRGPAALVHKHAILGGHPDWRGDVVTRQPMMARGKPAWFCERTMTGFAGITYTVEVDGYDSKAQRPLKGAYRKYHLSPDPVPVMIERLEYHAWLLGLDSLVTQLFGTLRDYEPVMARRVALPWAEEKNT